MKIRQHELWLADLNPQRGTEPGKVRPVVVVQTDLLNQIHPSTIICPLTTNVQSGSGILRLHLKKGESGVTADCDIMIDQLRAVDNNRFIKKIGQLHPQIVSHLTENLKTVLDL
jgi:mRNA interferase MazF